MYFVYHLGIMGPVLFDYNKRLIRDPIKRRHCITITFGFVSELALYALDVYYTQTYSGGSGGGGYGSGYNRIDSDQYQAKIPPSFQHL